MPKPNRNHKSGTPNGGGQIVNLTGLKKKVPGASPSILEAYRQLEALNGGAVGSLTTNTQRVVEPTRSRAIPQPPPSAVSDLRSLLRTATDGAKKPVPKINRSAARKASAVARTEPWRDIFLNQFPVATSTGEYARRHPLVPRTMEEIQEYLEIQDELKRNALSNIPAEPARILQSFVTHQPDVETHLASPELTQDDNAGTNYGGLLVGGISEAKEARRRGKSEFLRITTPEIAKQVAAAMRWKGPWTDYLNPKSRAVREYREFIRGGRVRSNYEDDPAALAMTSGSGRQLASIMAGDKDLQNASILGLLGRGASLVISPSRALAVYAGDLRRAEDIPTWEQGFNAVFDSGTQLLTGAAVERLGLSFGERALAKTGIGGFLKGSAAQSSESAIQQGLAQQAKGYLAGAGKAAVRSWADNQAYQLLPTLGQASDLSQKNGKSLAQNFGRLSLEGTVGMLRPYDPRVLSDPNVSAYEKAQILFQHGLSLYHNRDKAFNLVAKWAKANRVDPRVVRDVETQAESASRSTESAKSPKASSSGSKLDRSLARWSKQKPTSNSSVASGGIDASQVELHSNEKPRPEILRPGHSGPRDVKILLPGQEPLLEVHQTKGQFEAPYIHVKQSSVKDQFMGPDLNYFLDNGAQNGPIDIPALRVDKTHVGTYFNPETGASFKTQGGHDAGLSSEEYGRIAMRNHSSGAFRLHGATGALNGLGLVYVGGHESNLSSAHSAHATMAEFEAALRNGRITEKDLLSYVRENIYHKHKGSWKGLEAKYPIPNSLEEFYQMIGRDSMRMPHRKELVVRLFSKMQDTLPNYNTIAHLLSSEELRGSRAGDVVAAIYMDPNTRPADPASFGVPDHLAYDLALAGIHLGKTRPVNILEILPGEREAARRSVQRTLARKGMDSSKISEGQIYSRMAYILEHRKDRRMIGSSNADLLRKLVHE